MHPRDGADVIPQRSLNESATSIGSLNRNQSPAPVSGSPVNNNGDEIGTTTQNNCDHVAHSTNATRSDIAQLLQTLIDASTTSSGGESDGSGSSELDSTTSVYESSSSESPQNARAKRKKQHRFVEKKTTEINHRNAHKDRLKNRCTSGNDASTTESISNPIDDNQEVHFLRDQVNEYAEMLVAWFHDKLCFLCGLWMRDINSIPKRQKWYPSAKGSLSIRHD